MSRHKSRQQALEILFSREFHDENDIQYSENEILEDDTAVVDDVPADEDELSEQDEKKYCQYLIETATAHKTELDEVICSFAKGWDISRMNRTDRNIMRLALCELMYPGEQLPVSIILNEAIVLAKEYSGQKSARFINGILGAYVRSRS